MTTSAPEITVTCYVRPSMLLEPVDSHIRTLREAERDGQIDALLMRSWPDRISLSPDVPAGEALEAFERFTEWAYREGVDIEPAFAVQTRESTITGESREVLVTPLCCLAVYVGNTLVSVYPHVDDGEPHGVTEAVAALRTGEFRERAATLPVAATDECPRCGGVLVNGQGLYGCLGDDCAWVGLRADDGSLIEFDAGTDDPEAARERLRSLTAQR